MSRYYESMPVSPFIIAPVSKANAEASLILGPTYLSKRSVEIAQLIHGALADFSIVSPIVGQVFKYRQAVIVSTTLQTNVPDASSKRLGLKLTVGALIQPEALLHHETLTLKSFILIDQFIQRTSGAELSENGADKIVKRLQEEDVNLDEFFNEATLLIGWFESEFWVSAWKPAGLLSRLNGNLRRSRLMRRPRLKPAQTIQEITEYWRYIDRTLLPKKS